MRTTVEMTAVQNGAVGNRVTVRGFARHAQVKRLKGGEFSKLTNLEDVAFGQ